MALRLKPLQQQVIVITGATSGIGLVTARMAARRGAQVVAAARNGQALKQLVRELNREGAQAIGVECDVTKERDVENLAHTAIRQFGRVDTWVNNAGVSIYGKIVDVPIEDQRKLFEINYWGVVYGSRAAVKALRRNGGALINIGSTLSDRAIPVQGIYSASKFAVKGFTDALRMELEHDKLPISVTLIKPAAIDTPYRQHAKNYLGVEPVNPPPVYAPETVAKAILHCAEHPERDMFVGSAGKLFSSLEKYAPRMTDRAMEATLFDIQRSKKKVARPSGTGLDKASSSLHERGGYGEEYGMVRERSFYTASQMHPLLTTLAIGGAAVAGATWLGRRKKNDSELFRKVS